MQSVTGRAEERVFANLANVDTSPGFTFMVQTNAGDTLTYDVGESTATTSYESASTSKLVTAVVIMALVEDGTLSLDDRPQDHIASWPTSGVLAEITLTELLSFTSGLAESPLCLNSGRSDFTTCIERIPGANEASAGPGTEFFYGSSHMQVAGHMAVNASGADGWSDVFADFQATFAVLDDAAYDLPSAENPRLSGGMHWTAEGYLGFLAELVEGRILSDGGLATLMADQVGSASIANSPVLDARGQDWRYGLGVWIECSSAVYDCDEPTRVSSPGAYGAYPFIDLEHGYFGIVARQGRLGTFEEGIEIFELVEADLEAWVASR